MLHQGIRNKKANMVLDTFVIITVLFFLVVLGITMYPVVHDVNSDMQADPGIDARAKNLSAKFSDAYPSIWDSIIVLALVIMFIGTVVLAYMIDSSPIWFLLSCGLFVFVIIFAGIMSNAYSEISGDASMSAITDQFPMTNFIFSHLPIFITVIGFTIGIAIYSKLRAGR